MKVRPSVLRLEGPPQYVTSQHNTGPRPDGPGGLTVCAEHLRLADQHTLKVAAHSRKSTSDSIEWHDELKSRRARRWAFTTNHLPTRRNYAYTRLREVKGA